MTVSELIEILYECDSNAPVMIRDGFNGGGDLREINLGPYQSTIRPDENLDDADHEGLKVGDQVVIMGYGCY